MTRRLMGWLTVLVAILALGGRVASAESMDRTQVFQEASRFFQEASRAQDQTQSAELYRKAMIRFEKLVQDGVSNGKLYYNLGNTYFRLHDLGRAILNYRRALAYLPDDDNLRQNLRFAERQQPDRIEPQQETMIAKALLFWHYDFSARFRLILLAMANGTLWGVLAIALYRRKMPWAPVLAASLLVLMMSGSLAYDRFWRQAKGVIVAVEAVARKGDGAAYELSFSEPLHAGLTFSLVEKRGEWLYIELGDGRRCWVPSESAEMI